MEYYIRRETTSLLGEFESDDEAIDAFIDGNWEVDGNDASYILLDENATEIWE